MESYIAWHNIWANEHYEIKKFHLISYENLRKYTFETLTGVIRFIGVDKFNDSHVEDAIAYANFENMRKMEG